ncbi:CCN family member 3-like [Mytilus edulis]|uniref:CCN family member 3-like n=1 Tax=Mytilus edulis TaxID=6550 RepID=UPI0039EE1B37
MYVSTLGGSQHSNGSQWNDGPCYTCECRDPITNFYNCTGRCKAYPNLPSICTFKPDPTDSCCKVPDCGHYTAITENKFTGTIPPNKFNLFPIGTHSFFYGSSQNPNALQDTCLYKNKVYKQGASWDDGCDYVCTCLYGQLNGMYGCLSKCPGYPALPSYCKKNRVPGQCCPVISCDIPGYGTFDPDPQLVPTPIPIKIDQLITSAPTSLEPIIQFNPNPSQNTTEGILGGE